MKTYLVSVESKENGIPSRPEVEIKASSPFEAAQKIVQKKLIKAGDVGFVDFGKMLVDDKSKTWVWLWLKDEQNSNKMESLNIGGNVCVEEKSSCKNSVEV